MDKVAVTAFSAAVYKAGSFELRNKFSYLWGHR